MDSIFSKYSNIPMIVAPDRKKQNRTHRKNRINKKWVKRYGYTQYNFIEDDKVIILDGKMYMSQRAYNKMKNLLFT